MIKNPIDFLPVMLYDRHTGNSNKTSESLDKSNKNDYNKMGDKMNHHEKTK